MNASKWPTTVIAKKRGYGQCGILTPNPYFGDLGSWNRLAAELRAAAAARPADARVPKAFWRGKIENHEWKRPPRSINAARRLRLRYHGTCATSWEEGNRARLAATSLTLARPDRFDVKASLLDPPKDFSCVSDASGRRRESRHLWV